MTGAASDECEELGEGVSLGELPSVLREAESRGLRREGIAKLLFHSHA